MKKILQVFWVLIVVFVLLFIGGNFFVKNKISSALKDLEKENNFSYTDFDFKLYPAVLTVDSIKFEKKNNVVFIKKVKLDKINYLEFLSHKNIDIKEVFIEKPQIELVKNTDEKSTEKPEIDFEENLSIGKINIKEIDFIYKDEELVRLELEKYNLKLNDFEIDKEKLKKRLPFAYSSYEIKGGKLTYLLNKLQTLTTEEIEIQTENAVFTGIKLLPNYTRENYIKVIPHEEDLMDLDLRELKINDYKFHLNAEQDQFFVENISISKANFQIYRDKTIEDDPTIKKMYSEMLRDLPFGLSVDELQLRNVDLTYEEVQEKTGKTGKVFFTNMKADIKNLTNIDLDKEDFPETIVDIDCQFMGKSRLETLWTFKINDPADNFRIRGKSRDIPPKVINSFSDPAFNAQIKGEKIDALNFDFYGDKNTSQGKFHMVYEDLKVDIMKKGNDQEKNKVLSFLANIAMKHDRKSNDKIVEVSKVERDPTRSFWNYFWKNIFTGLKKTLI